MNNPADAPKGANIASDELAALARKVNGVRVRWPEMDTSDDSLEEVEASLRALASLKGEAINWSLVREGLDYFDRAGDAGDKLYVAEIRKALGQPSPAPQGGGEAGRCQHQHTVTVNGPSAATSSGIGCLVTGGRCLPGSCAECPATPPAQQPGN